MRVEPVLQYRECYYYTFLHLFPNTTVSTACGLQRIVPISTRRRFSGCYLVAIYNIYLPRNKSSFEILCFPHICTGQDPPVSRSVHTK